MHSVETGLRGNALGSLANYCVRVRVRIRVCEREREGERERGRDTVFIETAATRGLKKELFKSHHQKYELGGGGLQGQHIKILKSLWRCSGNN